MDNLQHLLDRNVQWARGKIDRDPRFFRRLLAQQSPEYLWIGCSDSRVPANEIVDLAPGELFVHRNVANVVSLSDDNVQAVLEYAIEQLKVKHVMVVGHYGCGGVQAVLEHRDCGKQTAKWLNNVVDVEVRYRDLIAQESTSPRQAALLCELNVLEQTIHVCQSPAVLAAWQAGQSLTVHGWIYHLSNGLLRHLDFTADAPIVAEELREASVAAILKTRQAHYARSNS